MKISKSMKTAFAWTLAIMSGVFLLYTSQSVHDKRRALHAVNAQIESQRQTLRVLKAEWAFLSSPVNLEKVVQDKKIDLGAGQPSQTLRTIEAAQPALGLPVNERVLDASLKE